MITLAALHLFNAVRYANDKDVRELADVQLEEIENFDREIATLQAEQADALKAWQ